MKKDFDCVEMKRHAQAEHRREAEELGEEEAARRHAEPEFVVATRLGPRTAGQPVHAASKNT